MFPDKKYQSVCHSLTKAEECLERLLYFLEAISMDPLCDLCLE